MRSMVEGFCSEQSSALQNPSTIPLTRDGPPPRETRGGQVRHSAATVIL